MLQAKRESNEMEITGLVAEVSPGGLSYGGKAKHSVSYVQIAEKWLRVISSLTFLMLLTNA